jgi:hypothetical protein
MRDSIQSKLDHVICNKLNNVVMVTVTWRTHKLIEWIIVGITWMLEVSHIIINRRSVQVTDNQIAFCLACDIPLRDRACRECKHK